MSLLPSNSRPFLLYFSPSFMSWFPSHICYFFLPVHPFVSSTYLPDSLFFSSIFFVLFYVLSSYSSFYSYYFSSSHFCALASHSSSYSFCFLIQLLPFIFTFSLPFSFPVPLTSLLLLSCSSFMSSFPFNLYIYFTLATFLPSHSIFLPFLSSLPTIFRTLFFSLLSPSGVFLLIISPHTQDLPFLYCLFFPSFSFRTLLFSFTFIILFHIQLSL